MSFSRFGGNDERIEGYTRTLEAKGFTVTRKCDRLTVSIEKED